MPQSHKGEPPEGEFTHQGRKISYRITEEGADLSIDGIPVMSAARVDGQYHSHMFMYRSFPNVRTLAKALVETEGKTWILRPGGAMPMPDKH